MFARSPVANITFESADVEVIRPCSGCSRPGKQGSPALRNPAYAHRQHSLTPLSLARCKLSPRQRAATD